MYAVNDSEPNSGPGFVAGQHARAVAACATIGYFDVPPHNPMTRARRHKVKASTLVGTWVKGDESTDVEYQVSRGTKGFVVQAVDHFDGEKAEIYDIKWDGEALTFATHWPSTGRLMKCRFLAVSPDCVDFTYTYSQQEMWHRKGAEPLAAPNRRPVAGRRVRKAAEGGGR